jgi:hypothetical protein
MLGAEFFLASKLDFIKVSVDFCHCERAFERVTFHVELCVWRKGQREPIICKLVFRQRVICQKAR